MSKQRPIVELKAPKDCSPEEFSEFCEIVKKGKQVDPVGLEGRMMNAEILAFMRPGKAMIGVGALKQQEPHYTEGIFKNAKSAQNSADFTLELGWVVVLENGHSYSRDIVKKLMEQSQGRRVYATSRETRGAMHKALENNDFAREGDAWPSHLADPPENLFLFVHKVR